jgi:hypothetical protein
MKVQGGQSFCVYMIISFNEMIDYDAFATPFILLNGEPMHQIDMDKINSTLNIK